MTDVTFASDGRLEGIFEPPEGGDAWGGVVVAHPHPLHGSTMAQPVVYRTAQACRTRGLATLRFNFRGVGESEGTYSGLDEYRDVEAAARFLRGRLDAEAGGAPGGGHRPLGLAGYSFGSMMAALAVSEDASGETPGMPPVDALALIAFVVTWKDIIPAVLERLSLFSGPVLAVCGEYDDIAPPKEVEGVLKAAGLDLTLTVIEGTDHFFGGVQKEVGDAVGAFFETAMRR